MKINANVPRQIAQPDAAHASALTESVRVLVIFQSKIAKIIRILIRSILSIFRYFTCYIIHYLLN